MQNRSYLVQFKERAKFIELFDVHALLGKTLEVPMYQLFHDGEASASVRKLKLPNDSEEWGTTGAAADYVYKLRRLLAKMGPDDQNLILHMAQKVARRS